MQTDTQTNKVVINFTAEKDSIILKSPMFSTLDIQKNGNRNYFLEIEKTYVDPIKEQIERNGGKILWWKTFVLIEDFLEEHFLLHY